MNKVLSDIKKGGIKNMMSYFSYEILDDDLLIIFFQSDKLFLDQHKLINRWKLSKFTSLYYRKKYIKLIRLCKPNYLNYVIYLYYYDDYYCDKCNKLKHGKRYKCGDCINIDMCKNCYYKCKKNCIECNHSKLFKYDYNNIFPKSIKVII